MTTHRYNPPERKPSQWGGLSDEAMRALSQVAMGPSDARELIADDVTATEEPIVEGLSIEVSSWACAELGNGVSEAALDSWRRYQAHLGLAVPRNFSELLRTNPNIAATLNRLYKAKCDLIASNMFNPDGLNIGTTMRLLVVPWQAFNDNLQNFTDWMVDMRAAQGVQPDYISDLKSIIEEDRPLYRKATNATHILTSTEYLTRKIAQDGPWGVVLIQCSDQAGIKEDPLRPLLTSSPDKMTRNGKDHCELNGHIIDSMGIYEWLSLTLQEDLSKLSSQDNSWMLANRLNHITDAQVPCGAWRNTGWPKDTVISGLISADTSHTNVRPRLMVM